MEWGSLSSFSRSGYQSLEFKLLEDTFGFYFYCVGGLEIVEGMCSIGFILFKTCQKYILSIFWFLEDSL